MVGDISVGFGLLEGVKRETMKLEMQDGSRKSTKKQTGEGEGIRRLPLQEEERERRCRLPRFLCL
jgi:hypothetical protein